MLPNLFSPLLLPSRLFFFRVFLAFIFADLLFYGLYLSPPSQFPTNDLIVIPKGISVREAGGILSEKRIIRSTALFSVIVKTFSRNGVIAGGYLFNEKENLITVAKRLAVGDHQLNTIKVTFPEGITVKEAAKICEKQLPLCKGEEFIALASQSEGYIFPDTYFFLQSTTAEEVFQTMKETFTRRLDPLEQEIRAYGKDLKQIVVMASIIEKEAQNFEDRQKIASILWKRLSIGMPLQTDSTLDYITNKNTYELTKDDLATTSPYNTYKYKGLPPTPIASPGLESIKAVLSSYPTKYLYFLSDRIGNFYYAENYDVHLLNKKRYLNHGI